MPKMRVATKTVHTQYYEGWIEISEEEYAEIEDDELVLTEGDRLLEEEFSLEEVGWDFRRYNEILDWGDEACAEDIEEENS